MEHLQCIEDIFSPITPVSDPERKEVKLYILEKFATNFFCSDERNKKSVIQLKPTFKYSEAVWAVITEQRTGLEHIHIEK